MWPHRLLWFWLVHGCSPKHSAVNGASPPEDSAALLLAEIDRLSPEDRLRIYGCEPEKWPRHWDDPREFLQALIELGEAEFAKAEQNTEIFGKESSACDVLDPLACCRDAYFTTAIGLEGGDSNLGRRAYSVNFDYLTSCRYAPRGYRSVRGCLNLVALSPLVRDYRDEVNDSRLTVPVPIPEEGRLDVLRQTLQAVQQGDIDDGDYLKIPL